MLYIQYFVVPDKINNMSYSHIPGIQPLSDVYTNVDQRAIFKFKRTNK